MTAHGCDVYKKSSYEQLLWFIHSFINEHNYDAMTDFFLTFRTYISALDLLDLLLKHYLQQDTTSTDISKGRKIRVFVALRHWLLNYYADDFLRNGTLRATMKAFLGRLGGVGADEITADAKIAKELRRIWDRESAIYESNLVGPKQVHPVLEAVRDSWFGGDCALVMKFRRSTRVVSRNLDQGRSSFGYHQLLMNLADYRSSRQHQTVTNDSEHAPSDQISADLDITECSETRIHPGFDSGEAAINPPGADNLLTSSEPRRKLRRKPGGNLKHMEELYNHPTQSLPPSDIPPSILVKGLDIGQDCHVQQEYSAWLLTIINASNADDEEPGSASLALANALDCLEGRHRKRKTSITEQLAEACEPISSLSNAVDSVERPSGSAKRKRRAGILQDASASPKKLARVSSSPSRKRSTKGTVLASPRSEEMVSMVEALAIPNHSMNIEDIEDELQENKGVESDWILSQNAALLAHSFGVVESAVFMELDWLELTSGLWIESSAALFEADEKHSVMDDERKGRALGTAIMTARFQRVVSWIIDQIKSCKDEPERIGKLTKLIDVAVLCKKYNNFATLMQIMTALQSAPIKRMRRMWNALPRDTTRVWKALLSLCDDREDWLTLQRFQEKALFDTQNSIVPFVGCYLSQLLQIERQTTNLDIVAKSRAIAKITRRLLVMHDRLRIETEYDSTMVACLSNVGL